jgi:hypothetical protein
MDNKDKMAFPFYEPGSGFGSVSEGLTKLEFIACNAPVDIPSWFKHTSPELEDVKAPKADSIANEEHRKQALAWIHDPIYDLPQELDWFQDQYERYWESKRQAAIADEQARYFQWRRFYAERLLTELSK